MGVGVGLGGCLLCRTVSRAAGTARVGCRRATADGMALRAITADSRAHEQRQIREGGYDRGGMVAISCPEALQDAP